LKIFFLKMKRFFLIMFYLVHLQINLQRYDYTCLHFQKSLKKKGKRDVPITDFFRKQKEFETITVQCPICLKTQEFNNEREMYIHVDQCIDSCNT
jgi:hypothetical protein